MAVHRACDSTATLPQRPNEGRATAPTDSEAGDKVMARWQIRDARPVS